MTERDAHGKVRHFANSMIGIVEDGCLLRIWGTQRDISEHKRADATRAYLAAIVESSDDAILSSTSTIVQACNHTAERLLPGRDGHSRAGADSARLGPRRTEPERYSSRRAHRSLRNRSGRERRPTIDISLTVSPDADGRRDHRGLENGARHRRGYTRGRQLAAKHSGRGTLASIGEPDCLESGRPCEIHELHR